MKFLPTSSLDQFTPPEPFVHATNWDQFRGQFRSSRSQRSGYRNSSQAAATLNRGLSSWDARGERREALNPFQIELLDERAFLPTENVDACFEDESLDFLACQLHSQDDMHGRTDGGVRSTSDPAEMDLELELMESLQDIAISLARSTARRVTQSAPASSENPLEHSS